MQNSESFLLDRLEDMFLSADRNVSLGYTKFLDGSEVAIAERLLKSLKKSYPQVDYTFYGGYSNAERKVLCIHSQYIEVTPSDFPVGVVRFDYNKNFSKLTHRDFLGAIMALQVTRDSIGDILVGDGTTQMVALDKVCKLITDEVTSVGRLGVKTTPLSEVTLQVEQKFKVISSTVASLRLDCLVGTALNISRTKSVQIVKSKLVTLNYLEVSSPDYLVKQGDILAIKGYGKFLVDTVSSEPTKKGRLHIVIKKYL
jgi:RNA-binding protein YlmH